MGAKATNPTGNEGTPEQAWSGVVRRRVTLPKALALALVPGLVFAAAAVSGVLVGISPDAALVATAFLLGAGAVAAMIAPIATRIEACEVTASRAGLRVGALWLPGEEITRGFLIPGDDLHGAVLRIERRGRPALHFDGSDPAVVSGLLRALGHDAGQRALQIGVLDRPHFYLGALGFIALMIFTGIVQQRLPTPFGTLLWAGVALGYLKRLPRRLIVAADGVTFEWLGGPQFIAAARHPPGIQLAEEGQHEFSRCCRGIAELGDGEPVWVFAQQADSRADGSPDCVDVEVHAVPLDEQSAPNQFAKHRAVNAIGGRWGEAACACLGKERVIRQRIGLCGRPDTSCINLEFRRESQHGALPLVEHRDIETEHATFLHVASKLFEHALDPARRNDPPAHGCVATHTGEGLELIGINPFPLGDDTVDGPVRPGFRCGANRRDVEDLTPTHRLVPPGFAQDEPVSRKKRQMLGHVYPDETLVTRTERLAAEDAHPDRELTGADIGHVSAPPRHPVIQRVEHAERRVEPGGRAPTRHLDHAVPAAKLRVLHPDQVEGHTLAGFHPFDRVTEGLDRADPDRVCARLTQYLHMVPCREGPTDQRSRDNRSRTAGGEDSIHPETWTTDVRCCRRSGDEEIQGRTQFLHPSARHRRDRHDRCRLQERATNVIENIHRGHLEPLVVHGVSLGEGNHTVPDSQQLKDPKMLLALGLPSLGGGDDEEARIDGPDAGKHVAQEPHVARHVHERDAGTRGQRCVSEAQIDREAPALFLLEPVRVGTGEREHERRLPVVHVASGGNHAYDGLSGGHGVRAPTAWATTGSSSGATVRRSR